MNDPHVSALIYRVKHNETVNYDMAMPLEYETDIFKVLIKDREARFEMKDHFPNAEQARQVIEPFIRQWEFATNLEEGPGEFVLVFLDAVVEDRKATPDVVHLKGMAIGCAIGSVSVMVGKSAYPQPPTDVAMNADVESMARRYSLYREGKNTLADMAYFCLTIVDSAAGNRPAVPSKFGIASSVMSKLAHLTGEGGGADARKGKGRSHKFTADERNWIDQATKRLIRRVAEVAHDPAAAASQITLGDLPKL